MMKKIKNKGQQFAIPTKSVSKMLLALSIPLLPAHAIGEGGGDATNTLEEIIVTSQMREQNLDDVSLAVSAFNSESLASLKVKNAEDLQYLVPGMRINGFYGKVKANLSIRGLSLAKSFRATDSQPVGVHMDGVYLDSRSVAILQMYDMERMEVMRGPQGTLSGKNTSAGSLNYYTAKPSDEFEGFLDLGYGSFDTFSAEGGVSIPISDSLSSRISFSREKSDGWAKNVVSGKDIFDTDLESARIALRYKTASTEWNFKVYHSNVEEDGANFFFVEPFVNSLDYDELPGDHGDAPLSLDHQGANLEADFELNESFTLKSLTAFDENDLALIEFFSGPSVADFPVSGRNGGFSGSGVPFSVASFDGAQQLSQEFRLSYVGDDRLFGALGIYYLTSEIESLTAPGLRTTPVNSSNANSRSVMDTDSVAIYFNGSYNFNEQYSVTGGLRYTKESKDFFITRISGFEAQDSDTWTKPTYKVALEYTPNEGALFYASLSTGFHSGTWNAGASSPQNFAKVDPTTNTSFEVGTKTVFADGRGQLYLTLFKSTVEDLQVNKGTPIFNPATNTTTNVFLLQNAAEIKSEGVELETKYLFENGFSIDAQLAYIDAEYEDFENFRVSAVDPNVLESATGNMVVGTPRWSGSLALKYEYSLNSGAKITPQVLYSYTGDQFFEVENDDFSFLGKRKIVNAYLEWVSPDNRYTITLWGKNLTNEEYKVSSQDLTAGFPGAQTDTFTKRGPTRSAGISGRINF